jgi:hypothetical protein
MITCPFCKRSSHNPNDVANNYCGNCHRFLTDAEVGEIVEDDYLREHLEREPNAPQENA